MDKLFSILSSNPLATLLVAGVLILVFMVLFRKTIERYLIKKYKLFTEQEVKTFAKTMINGKQYSKKQIDTAIETRFKKYMKAKAVLLMFLISLISYTGFSHTDLRQNSDVDDIVCISADSVTTSGVASVDFNLQNSNCSYVHSPTKRDEIMIIIGTKQFNQVTFPYYPITDVGKEITPYLFNPLAIIRAVNLYNKTNFNTNKYDEIRPNTWLTKRTRNPRDGLICS